MGREGMCAHLEETRLRKSRSRKRPRKPFAPVSSTFSGSAGSSSAPTALVTCSAHVPALRDEPDAALCAPVL